MKALASFLLLASLAAKSFEDRGITVPLCCALLVQYSLNYRGPEEMLAEQGLIPAILALEVETG
jgi:hypothetical protein